ncbi:MAG TPA: sugar ABC transporter ATP-binding protein [Firmicutes bacterium]|nr:sugar ABC transporter ATP-binding protein [Bacillota bacterium]
MNDNILDIQNITKNFAGVKALDNVSFSVKRGEVHALMGENGAGKSTLIKILTGIYRADTGEIFFDEKKCVFPNALSAQHAGISTIYQELNMIPYLSVSENIFLGRYPMKREGIDWKTMNEKAQKLVDDIGVKIDARKPLNTYGTAKQQIISILRAISLESKLIVMDEPTSSLDTNEVDILFGIIDKLKKNGVAIIFISHRLDEVYRMCDRITVLKDGQYEGTYESKELSQYDLLNKMIGRKIVAGDNQKAKRDMSGEDCVLEVSHINRVPHVRDVSFELHRGEIVGFAGLLGAGRTEIARIIFGCDIPDSGEIKVENQPVHFRTPTDAVAHGLAFCTENRREEGLFPDISVQNNISVSALSQICTAGFIHLKKRKQLSTGYIEKLGIKTPSGEQLIKNLSGGNQQKVILARWLATNPKLIIFDEPTRGIDVGAKQEIEKLICEFSERGISVLFISSEMSELVRNCDRIIVLRDGMIVGELKGDEISEKNIMWIIANKKSIDSLM